MNPLTLLLILVPVVISNALSTGPIGQSKVIRYPDLPDDVLHALSHAPLARADASTVIKSWQEFLNRAPLWAESWSSGLRDRLDRVTSDQNHTVISSECRESLVRSIESVKRLDAWALKLVDSWGRFPMAGVMEGTVTDFGSYDECVNIDPNDIIGRAQYCTIEMKPLLPPRPRYHNLVHTMDVFHNLSSIQGQPGKINSHLIEFVHFFYYINLRVGVCLPSKCSLAEVDHIVNDVAKDLVLQGRAVRCEVRDEFTGFDGYQIIGLLTLAFLLMTAFIGTMLDLFLYDSSDIPLSKLSSAKRCFLSFSVPRNFVSIFNSDSSESHLSCLHGFRVLTMGWVVMGHTYALTNHQAFARGFRITEIVTAFSGQWFFNGTLSVDTFFFISGMLTTYVTWKVTKGRKSLFNLPAFILARLMRLLPPLMVTIALTSFLPLFGSGPGWHEMIDPVVNNCKKNWWTNLTFLSTWIDTRNICLLHTWFLANDMHFHLMSLIVIIPLFRSKKLGLTINAILLSASILLTAVINYVNDYPPAMLYTQPEIEERWDLNFDFYWKPWSHIGPYCIGMGLGYFMATTRVTVMSRKNRLLSWLASLSILFTVLFGVYFWNMGWETSAFVNAVYSSTHRTVWSIGLSWVVYACITGQGGFINSFLSWKGFIPMSRLTFMVYLVHPWLIWIYMGNARQLVDTTHYTGFYIFLPHWILSYVVGLVFTLLVESPVMGLQKELLHKLAPASMSKDLSLNPAENGLKSGSVVKQQQQQQNPITLPAYEQLERTSDEAEVISPDNNNHNDDRVDQQQQPHRRISLFGIPFLATHRNGNMNMIRITNPVNGTSAAAAAAADEAASVPLVTHPDSDAGSTQV